jgi:hypothetical protein
MSFFGGLLVIIGIFVAPIFTLSMVLYWAGCPFLGTVALVISLLAGGVRLANS